ncbi:hypothetical protein LTS14_002732 [Recurvomyces mirabilis]|uniref:uncharacterized protein n=1 Tax=Recurvomyces mirabilis TaxID=574656 RepID=UPI002DDE3424|nr:hypothetical protein LTS14_002732 [Recurvomyces mirabilis]
MDVLTGLGAASAIVQLVQFSYNVAKSARNIYRNFTNASEKNYLVAESLLKELALFDKYASGLRTFMSAKEVDASVAAAVEPLLDCCLRVKGDRGRLLDRLQIQGGTGKLERLRAAIRVEKETNAMLGLQKELRSLQTRVIHFMMFILAERQSSHYKMVEARHQQNAKYESELMARVSALQDMVKDLTVTQRDEAIMVQQVLRDLKTFAFETQECLYVRRVLQSLRYEALDARNDEITNPHKDTFRWLLDPDRTKASPGQASIVDWLRSGSGLYWISGKPGAGKSTLMKMLCADDRTVTLLSQWAGGQRVVRASHFFWIAGSTMQKNQLGLLQSLCFSILKQHPSLLPVFVREKLQPHVVHARASEANVKHLVEEVTKRAKGVFLWELTKSLNNRVSFFDVCRRLEGIPTDLEAFFRRKVNNIEEFYWQQSARTFLVCMHADGPLKLIGLAALEENDTLADKICDMAGRAVLIHRLYDICNGEVGSLVQDIFGTESVDLAIYARQMESQQQEPPYHALASLHQILLTDSDHFYLDKTYDVNAWFFHLCAQECLLSFLAQYMLDEASAFKVVCASTPGWVVGCPLQSSVSKEGEEPGIDLFDLDLIRQATIGVGLLLNH